jgi:formylglycine-generating enzyme required for sulfatase activity/nitrate/TMAO reductase-like tetraheme cytochrome c subunit
MSLKRKKNTEKESILKSRSLHLLFGAILGAGTVISLYLTSVYLSSDESCMMCHVHPHVEDSWKLSQHMNNASGTKVHCIDCHLPPRNNTWSHHAAKLKLGIKDLWGYLTKDSLDFDWERLSGLETAVTYIPNESCKECHFNLFPNGINDDGLTAHLYYEENETKLNLHCISCHLDAGHYNPNYKHAKLTFVQDVLDRDTSLYYKTSTAIVRFSNYTEQIPGTPVSFNMIAIPGGTFRMGSPDSEPFHNDDEQPVHTVTLSPFFMSELEVTWDMYWSFYSETMSEGRIPPDEVYANNSRPDVDAISGPTPPFGLPDQGWGGGERPAITMTHYAAETFCQWLSQTTGKTYRLPTEAEWEYAARGGTETPYFFKGSPKSFSNEGFWRKIFDAETEVISRYVVYSNNSKSRTQTPDLVEANPFGLKNMLGNVMEYCADKYDAQYYGKHIEGVVDPLNVEGKEWVIRGGSYASDAAEVRCAARDFSRHEAWLKTDPQQPKSIWWYSDIRSIGFRIVCETPDDIKLTL